jgi:hypothetical protein
MINFDFSIQIVVHIGSYVIIAGLFGALAWLYRKPIQPPCQPVGMFYRPNYIVVPLIHLMCVRLSIIGGVYAWLHSSSIVSWLCHAPVPSPILPVHIAKPHDKAPNGATNGSRESTSSSSSGLTDGLNLLFCFMGIQVCRRFLHYISL